MTKTQLLQRMREDLQEIEHAVMHQPSEELIESRIAIQARIQELELELSQGQ